MILKIDNAGDDLFNVADAATLDGRRATIVAADGTAVARATLRSLSPNAVRLEDRDEFASGDRYFIRDSGAVHGTAVRLREGEVRPEQASFRERVGAAWGWRCAISGETVRQVLDAAHLPGSSWRGGRNEAVDGILLRADLHRLLDAGLLRIEGGIVRVDVGSYARFDGRVVGTSAKAAD
jgi:hypothetical protein